MTQLREARRQHASESIVDLTVDGGSVSTGFADRRDAGRRLASLLCDFRYEDPVVVGIARDGMPVAAEVARALQAPLDVVVVAARCAHYQATHPRPAVVGRTVLLIDDGLTAAENVQTATSSLRTRGANRVILATLFVAAQSAHKLRQWVDQMVCIEMRRHPVIGRSYEDFSPTSDEEVVALLSEPAGAVARKVRIQLAPSVVLSGDLTVPWGAYGRGLVAFAHGSGSSRMSPRNHRVASALNEAGFATLLFDLLTPREEGDRANVFDVPLLAQRLVAATHWLRRQPETARLAIGYFGASTGAAAALLAAAELRAGVCAVVSRGGRPDLAQERLGEVVAPVMLIVGGADPEVLELNRQASLRLRCESELAVIPGATHLFEAPEALEQVTRKAIGWFTQHLGEGAPTR